MVKSGLARACWVPLALFGSVTAPAGAAAGAADALAPIEAAYADFNDAYGAVSLIDSDPASYPDGYAGRSRAGWQELYVARRTELLESFAAAPPPASSALDARARRLMRADVGASSATPRSPAPTGRCSDAQRADLALRALQDALYACFAELGNSLRFEQGTLTRVAAFDLLARLPEAERRKALFLAFAPLWQALAGDDGPQSPYRRMIRLAAAGARGADSPVVAAARAVGVSSAEAERWLERILDTWRRFGGAHELEPWDYRFAGGAAERALGARIAREALLPLNQRYFLDLGLDLAKSQVIYDLEPRADKAPLAYTDYVRRGRLVDGRWQPTLVRVSASYEHGGLGVLEELVHENGHVAHMLALRTRPAFMDVGDAIFDEAFADVPAWSVYEPAWQQKYLGHSIGASESLRAHFAEVMLDVAWALFDLRMLSHPSADPNRVWTDITHRYLHVRPHPELAWWAVRVQLVDTPGYMVNYGLGAVITADIRARIAQRLAPFDAGEERWYGWLSAQLLASGEERPTAQLLRHFLGRPVSPAALLRQLERLGPPAGTAADARAGVP